MKLKKKKSIQFDFAKVVELTEDELKTKVIGGQSLSAAEQYEIAQKAARGDYSGVEQVQSSSENNILDYGKETSNDTPKKSANIDEREKMDTVSKAPANIDEREKADSGGAEAVETSATASDKAKSGSLKSGSIDEREKNDTAVKVSNIDEREKRDGSSGAGYNSESYSNGSGKNSSGNVKTGSIDKREKNDNFDIDEYYDGVSSNIDEREERELAIKNKKEKFMDAARSKIGTKYEKTKEYPVDPYQCDNYAQEVFELANMSWEDYFAGDASWNNVAGHINSVTERKGVEKNKRYNAPELDDGIYLVFMGECTRSGEPDHTGFVYIDNGTISYIDNSSDNPNVGVYEQSFNSLSNFQSEYAYNNFYYQKII